MIMANTSTCSIFPSAKDAIGFDGISDCTVSNRLVKGVASTLDSIISILTPCPSPSAFGKNRPIRLATKVVMT